MYLSINVGLLIFIQASEPTQEEQDKQDQIEANQYGMTVEEIRKRNAEASARSAGVEVDESDELEQEVEKIYKEMVCNTFIIDRSNV